MNHKKIIIKSLIISLILWILFYIVGYITRSFVTLCKTNGNCPGQLENYLIFSIVFLPLTFLIILGINYLIEYLKKKF